VSESSGRFAEFSPEFRSDFDCLPAISFIHPFLDQGAEMRQLLAALAEQMNPLHEHISAVVELSSVNELLNLIFGMLRQFGCHGISP